jgi:hypothetical protein
MIGRRGLALLGGAAAAALGGGLLLAPEAERQDPAPETAFPGLAGRLPRAARVELRQDGAALNLLRQGEDWGIAERQGHPCQTGRLRELFAGLSELRLLEPRAAEARTGTDGALAAPAVLIRVLDAEGAPLASWSWASAAAAPARRRPSCAAPRSRCLAGRDAPRHPARPAALARARHRRPAGPAPAPRRGDARRRGPPRAA